MCGLSQCGEPLSLFFTTVPSFLHCVRIHVFILPIPLFPSFPPATSSLGTDSTGLTRKYTTLSDHWTSRARTMAHPHRHRLYRGHRAKSLNITEEELVEIRARERTFDGAYWRTAMKSFSMGMLIIRLFTRSFYKVGIIFVAFGMAMLGIAFLRRKAAGDVFDQRKPFETSGFWVMMTTLVTTITYFIIFALIMRL